MRGSRVIGLLLVVAGCGGDPPELRFGAPARLLGRPFREASPYARNVWDMQRYRGHIYLGHGDLADNWGPVRVWAIDPARGSLAEAYRTDGEQVGRLRVLDDGALYVPAMDPRGRGTGGGFDRLADGWTRRRTISGALHTFDVARFHGTLFAALGGRGNTWSLARSHDGGVSWTAASSGTERIYTLIRFADALYAAPRFRADAGSRLLRWNSHEFSPTALGSSEVLPALPDTSGSIPRAEEFAGRLVYVGARGAVDWRPYALLALQPETDSAARLVPLPRTDAVPYDLLVRADTLYLLAAAGAAPHFEVMVYSTRDLTRWEEVVHFSSPSFARSFEEDGGTFFFGLGCEYHSPSDACGAIATVGPVDWNPG